MTDAIKLGVLGIDHPHIFGMLDNLLKHGCSCEKWWTNETAFTEELFAATYPAISKASNKAQIIEDPNINLILISAVPEDRAALAIEAMYAGKDVMVDKPGCTTLEQLQAIKDCVKETGRIWTINFSERFEVPAVVKAEELIASGAIGRIIQTIGTGPHQLGLNKRPDWFYQRKRFGGILCDIGSHQVDQFLFFTGSNDATVSHSLVQNTSMPNQPEFQDYGQMTLTGNNGHGFIRVDWFTPDGLGVWGDGRLTILGDKGYIELRKYIDVARDPKGNHLYLVNDTTAEHIDCNDVELTYSPRLINDILNRSETAVTQVHTFKAMELALIAQQQAEAARTQ